MEIWKDIKDYEGLYQISNLGRVKSLPKRRRLGTGYQEEIFLKEKGGAKRICLQRKTEK